MDLQRIFLLGTVFLFAASLVELIYLVWTESKFAEKRTVKKRLLYISAGGLHGQEVLSKYKDRVLRQTGVFERLVFSMPRIKNLDRLLIHSGLPLNTSSFLMLCTSLAIAGGLVGFYFFPGVTSPLIFGLILFLAPFLLLKRFETKTLAVFEAQLPEALDLLSRAVRSGHAFSAGLEMVSEEMTPPLSSEFQAMVDEMNLGLSLKEALANLTERVPSQDLRFFAIAVSIQKETGGNIAEIFDNLSRLIRERIQFRRQVQSLTAEGRLSGWILIFLPIVMFGVLYFLNYNYVSLLWTDPKGFLMIIGMSILMILGIFVIRRIVNIEI